MLLSKVRAHLIPFHFMVDTYAWERERGKGEG
jgi:hypothetical protein